MQIYDLRVTEKLQFYYAGIKIEINTTLILFLKKRTGSLYHNIPISKLLLA